jgi:hypothetical protein
VKLPAYPANSGTGLPGNVASYIVPLPPCHRQGPRHEEKSSFIEASKMKENCRTIRTCPSLYRWCFSLKQGDFKRPAVVRKDYMGGIDLHNLHPLDYGPLGGDGAVDQGEGLLRFF